MSVSAPLSYAERARSKSNNARPRPSAAAAPETNAAAYPLPGQPATTTSSTHPRAAPVSSESTSSMPAASNNSGDPAPGAGMRMSSGTGSSVSSSALPHSSSSSASTDPTTTINSQSLSGDSPPVQKPVQNVWSVRKEAMATRRPPSATTTTTATSKSTPNASAAPAASTSEVTPTLLRTQQPNDAPPPLSGVSAVSAASTSDDPFVVSAKRAPPTTVQVLTHAQSSSHPQTHGHARSASRNPNNNPNADAIDAALNVDDESWPEIGKTVPPVTDPAPSVSIVAVNGHVHGDGDAEREKEKGQKGDKPKWKPIPREELQAAADQYRAQQHRQQHQGQGQTHYRSASQSHSHHSGSASQSQSRNASRAPVRPNGPNHVGITNSGGNNGGASASNGPSAPSSVAGTSPNPNPSGGAGPPPSAFNYGRMHGRSTSNASTSTSVGLPVQGQQSRGQSHAGSLAGSRMSSTQSSPKALGMRGRRPLPGFGPGNYGEDFSAGGPQSNRGGLQVYSTGYPGGGPISHSVSLSASAHSSHPGSGATSPRFPPTSSSGSYQNNLNSMAFPLPPQPHTQYGYPPPPPPHLHQTATSQHSQQSQPSDPSSSSYHPPGFYAPPPPGPMYGGWYGYPLPHTGQYWPQGAPPQQSQPQPQNQSQPDVQPQSQNKIDEDARRREEDSMGGGSGDGETVQHPVRGRSRRSTKDVMFGSLDKVEVERAGSLAVVDGGACQDDDSKEANGDNDGEVEKVVAIGMQPGEIAPHAHSRRRTSTNTGLMEGRGVDAVERAASAGERGASKWMFGSAGMDGETEEPNSLLEGEHQDQQYSVGPDASIPTSTSIAYRLPSVQQIPAPFIHQPQAQPMPFSPPLHPSMTPPIALGLAHPAGPGSLSPAHVLSPTGVLSLSGSPHLNAHLVPGNGSPGMLAHGSPAMLPHPQQMHIPPYLVPPPPLSLEGPLHPPPPPHPHAHQPSLDSVPPPPLPPHGHVVYRGTPGDEWQVKDYGYIPPIHGHALPPPGAPIYELSTSQGPPGPPVQLSQPQQNSTPQSPQQQPPPPSSFSGPQSPQQSHYSTSPQITPPRPTQQHQRDWTPASASGIGSITGSSGGGRGRRGGFDRGGFRGRGRGFPGSGRGAYTGRGFGGVGGGIRGGFRGGARGVQHQAQQQQYTGTYQPYQPQGPYGPGGGMYRSSPPTHYDTLPSPLSAPGMYDGPTMAPGYYPGMYAAPPYFEPPPHLQAQPLYGLPPHLSQQPLQQQQGQQPLSPVTQQQEYGGIGAPVGVNGTIAVGNAPPVPQPAPVTRITFPLDSLRWYLLGQVEYYFSAQNLAQDFFLRQKMDSRGWLPITLIASFNRIQRLTPDPQLVRDVLGLSSILETTGDFVRMRDSAWVPFVLPTAEKSVVEDGQGDDAGPVASWNADADEGGVVNGAMVEGGEGVTKEEVVEEEEEEDVEFVMGS